MAEQSSTPGDSGSINKRGAVPAWKLRQALRDNATKLTSKIDPKEALKKKMEEAALDPNLPPAFKVAMKGRVAFAKQQARRKNNDTFVSMNSSHPVSKLQQKAEIVDSDDDSSFASMGEEILEEE